MGYTTRYTGPKIDAALERGRNLRVVNNGWIRLDSSLTSHINLGDLKNVGNYSVAFWTDGPNIGNISASPINIVIAQVNADLYQFAEIVGKKYARVMHANESVYGAWELDQSAGAVNPGPNAPSSPVDGKTLWMDTSNPAAPILKLFIDNQWKEIIPANAMQASVYDPQGKRTDIFAYIDQQIAEASLGEIVTDFNTHINNINIHVTAAEKAKWDSSATTTDVTNAANALQSNLYTKVHEVVEEDIAIVEQLNTNVTNLGNTVNAHTNNESIHPSAAKQAEWDNKAPGDHEHNLDGRVTIDADHVVGIISSEQLPFDVKERAYMVGNISDMYALTKNPIHNGDAIFVADGNGSGWYFVVDDEKLGDATIDGWTEGTIGSTNRRWESVCYGGGKFVAVAYNSNIFAYSIDGITWTEVTVGSDARGWVSVCYGNGKFVAVTLLNAVFVYSTDGITWVFINSPQNIRGWLSVCYGADKFVAVAGYYDGHYDCRTNKFAYSIDGITWTEGTIGTTNGCWHSVCYGNGKYVAVRLSSNIFAYSLDGITWTEVSVGSTTIDWRSVCYGNGKYVAVANGTTIFAYSIDGITWTNGSMPNNRYWKSVYYDNGKYVVVANYSGTFAYSIDGITWTEGTISNAYRYWYSVCYGNGKFVTVSDNSNSFAYATLNPAYMSAFKKIASANEEITWDKIVETPNTLTGYGIVDAAPKQEFETLQAQVTEVIAELPAETDLSAVAQTQTSYNTIVSNLESMDSLFNIFDEVIIKLTRISS